MEEPIANHSSTKIVLPHIPLTPPFKSSRARLSKPQADIYALHGKYILEQYLIPKLSKEPWTWPIPTENKAVEESVSKAVGILGLGRSPNQAPSQATICCPRLHHLGLLVLIIFLLA